MLDLTGKVAVVTGAASGIGRALAGRFAGRGMRVVLADVERAPLDAAAAELASKGAEVLACPTDVSRAEEVEALARRTIEAFGAVHVVCNNAGVALSGPIWEATLDDWRWVLGVNLWGVIHGVRSFVPILLEQGGFAHVVNTASMSGLVCLPNMGIYNASKHAVVALSESLQHDLDERGSPIRVSVLCPGYVDTRIIDSARNRPGSGGGAAAARAPSASTEEPRAPNPQDEARRAATRAALRTVGRSADEVAACVVEAIDEPRFYVLSHPERKDGVRVRFEGILDGRVPRFVPLA